MATSASNAFLQMAFNLGNLYGQQLRHNDEEADERKGNEAFEDIQNGDYDFASGMNKSNAQSSNPYLQNMQQYVQTANGMANDGSTASTDGQSTMAQVANGQYPRYTATGAGSFTATHDPNAYNGTVDTSIGTSNKYINGIDSAKLEYAMAEQQGDQAGMERANAKAEYWRQQANTDGVTLPYSYRTASSGSYEQAQNEKQAIRNQLASGQTTAPATTAPATYDLAQGMNAYNAQSANPYQQSLSYSELANGNVPQAQVQNNPTTATSYANPTTAVTPTANGGGTGTQVGASNLTTAQAPTASTIADTQAKVNQLMQNQTGSSIPNRYQFNTPNFASFLKGSTGY